MSIINSEIMAGRDSREDEDFAEYNLENESTEPNAVSQYEGSNEEEITFTGVQQSLGMGRGFSGGRESHSRTRQSSGQSPSRQDRTPGPTPRNILGALRGRGPGEESVGPESVQGAMPPKTPSGLGGWMPSSMSGRGRGSALTELQRRVQGDREYSREKPEISETSGAAVISGICPSMPDYPINRGNQADVRRGLAERSSYTSQPVIDSSQTVNHHNQPDMSNNTSQPINHRNYADVIHYSIPAGISGTCPTMPECPTSGNKAVNSRHLIDRDNYMIQPNDSLLYPAIESQVPRYIHPQSIPVNERYVPPELMPPREKLNPRQYAHMSVGAKLGTFDGSKCFETFMAKFENCSQYFKWDPNDQVFQLKAALEGPAGQILWDLPPEATLESIKRLLRCRFGSENQAERFRAELRVRRRKTGETLQCLYQDIRRLMTLAYPGPTSGLSEIVGRDAFLEALSNQSLRVRILEKEPKTLDEALNAAVRLEAFELTDSTGLSEKEEARRKQANQHVRTSNADQDGLGIVVGLASDQTSAAILEMQRMMLAMQKQMNALGVGQHTSSSSKEFSPRQKEEGEASGSKEYPSSSHTSNSRNSGSRGRGRGGAGRGSRGCHGCGEMGHWIRDCPKNHNGGEGETLSSKVVTGTVDVKCRAVYIRAIIEGRKVYALLDSGCETTVMGRGIVPFLELQPTTRRLTAANGTEIPVLGEGIIDLQVGRSIEKRLVLVSHHVSEAILGIDFLKDRGCSWNFINDRVTVDGVLIQLYTRPGRLALRKIYASARVEIPARCEIDVPVRVPWITRWPEDTALLTEPRVLREGVMSARTLISAAALDSAVHVINVSDKSVILVTDELLAIAEEQSIEEINPSKIPTVEKVEKEVDNRVPEHVRKIVEGFAKSLSSEERQKAEEFVIKSASIFSSSEFDLGKVNIIPHTIDTGSSKPFKQQLRRHPVAYLQFIDDEVDKMLQHGIVEATSSPWASNVVLIKKPSGDWRFCVDFRQLNLCTVKDSYPLPRIDLCMDALGGAQWFTTLDLRSGYWQVALDPESAQKTAFVTRKGVWKFNVLAFGLSNAPAIFQRVIDLVLTGLTWQVCLAFLDDIIVMSESFSQHIERLTLVFERLKTVGLKLNPGKCRLFQESVKFLGSIVSRAGIHPDPEKVRAVAEWPVPRSLTETRAFVALASYYRRHILGFAEIARPLHELTRKGVRFHWGVNQQSAFVKLKKCLTTAPVVSAPDSEGLFILDTDASDDSLGAVLQQEQNGVVKVIAYASRALLAAEKSYCTTRKELLAIIYGLKQFRHYLLCQKFQLRTDHAALTSLQRSPEPVGQQARWLDLLAEYNIDIVHRPGAQHNNADSLSRRPCQRDKSVCEQCAKKIPAPLIEFDVKETECEHDQETTYKKMSYFDDLENLQGVVASTEDQGPDAGSRADPVAEQCAGFQVGLSTGQEVRGLTVGPTADLKSGRCAGSSVGLEAGQKVRVHKNREKSSPSIPEITLSSELIRKEQSENSTINTVMKLLRENPENQSINSAAAYDKEVQQLWSQYLVLRIEDGILVRQFYNSFGDIEYRQIIMPPALRKELLSVVHGGKEFGHFGVNKTMKQLQVYAYWVDGKMMWRNM